MLHYLCFSLSTAGRPTSAIGSAIVRPYLALSRIRAQGGILDRLVLNRLGGLNRMQGHRAGEKSSWLVQAGWEKKKGARGAGGGKTFGVFLGVLGFVSVGGVGGVERDGQRGGCLREDGQGPWGRRLSRATKGKNGQVRRFIRKRLENFLKTVRKRFEHDQPNFPSFQT